MLNNNMYFTGLEIFVYTIVVILGRNGGGGKHFNSILQRDTYNTRRSEHLNGKGGIPWEMKNAAHFYFRPPSPITSCIRQHIDRRIDCIAFASLWVCDRHLRMLYILISCLLRLKWVDDLLYLCCPSFGFHNSEPYNAMRRNIRWNGFYHDSVFCIVPPSGSSLIMSWMMEQRVGETVVVLVSNIIRQFSSLNYIINEKFKSESWIAVHFDFVPSFWFQMFWTCTSTEQDYSTT